MAKACACLCRQCCFIDGFGEIAEFPTITPRTGHVSKVQGHREHFFSKMNFSG